MLSFRTVMLATLGAAFLAAAAPSFAQTMRDDSDVTPQRRTRITIYPQRRQLGPNAQRQCTAWLEKEYRVSGTVIVPRERCWWE
ncbi:MAG: hypothetical protein JO205_14885 [Pseudolabrys sp.]|nr:hypothetical protein [Pseudolabrys sp.]